MTREELQEEMEIHWRAALPGADIMEDFSKMAVEYAISVLESYTKDLPPIPGVDRAYKKHIEELKTQLK